jgi:hypothetical protein
MSCLWQNAEKLIPLHLLRYAFVRGRDVVAVGKPTHDFDVALLENYCAKCSQNGSDIVVDISRALKFLAFAALENAEMTRPELSHP